MKIPSYPPRWAERLLERYGAADSLEEVLGDLRELYAYWLEMKGQGPARRRYVLNVLKLLRPFEKHRTHTDYSTPNYPAMFRSYLKIAFRNLLRNRVSSFINIGGLAVGMAVAMLIGLWIDDELSYDQYHQHYDRIAQVMKHTTHQGEVETGPYMPIPLGKVLRTSFPEDFTSVVMSTWAEEHILAYGDKKLTKTGHFMGSEAPQMLTLTMRKGTRAGLTDPSSILLSQSLSNAFFGDDEPIGKLIKLDNTVTVKVRGVYEDLPYNTSFRDMTFIAPWELYLSSGAWVKQAQTDWSNHS